MASSDGASSISVAVRVRPFTIREAAQLTKQDEGPLFLGEGSLAGAPIVKLSQKNVRAVVKVVDERCLIFDPPEDNPLQKFSRSVIPTGKRVKDQTFAFDRVFDENTTQSDVYESTTKGLLNNFMDGYNATVFAYGATGCGKTHTITGTVQQPGIIFLTMQELFERISDAQNDKITEITLSYLEIYNETIRDLLVPGGSKQGLMLREDATQAVSVAGLSSHRPQNVQEVMDMIVRGNENRTMSPTEANATSSRSHAVLQVNLSQKDRNASISEPHTMATLSVIDLAGSERASATKNRGERLTEGANINKSLLALGSCINALCDPRRRNHVPYRNSKLTRLLKFSLGGNCKTVMIVCISPSSIHYDETQNTLRYANRAKNIQTKITRNVFNVDRHVKDFLKKIDEQMGMINELKAQQKEYEKHAFARYRKQEDKRFHVMQEAIARLHTAAGHCRNEQQEKIMHMRKLRQIERRIALIQCWLSAFESICEARDDTQGKGLSSIMALHKSAKGILVELEESRHHYHQCLAKINWQRPLDTALSIGLEQLQQFEGDTEVKELAMLERETDMLKASGERELYSKVLDINKDDDLELTSILLKTNFETITTINQLLTMDEADAVIAAKSILNKLILSCSDAATHVIKPDSSRLVTKAFPPTRSGTPKKVRSSSLQGHSPGNPLLATVLYSEQLSSTPSKASPKRRILGGVARRGISFTPRRKTPTKRVVRWRDDAEDGKLVEYQKTPSQTESSPPHPDLFSSSDTEAQTSPSMPEGKQGETTHNSLTSSTSHTKVAVQPKTNSFSAQRFKAGFLARRPNEHPELPLANQVPFQSEPSPLSDLSASQLNKRTCSGRIVSPISQSKTGEDDSPLFNYKQSLPLDGDGKEQIREAIKHSALSRRNSLAQHTNIRRSPPASSPLRSSVSPDNVSHTTHVRRSELRHSVLSPKSTPIAKGGLGHRRTTTTGDQRLSIRTTNRGGGHVRNSSTGVDITFAKKSPSISSDLTRL